MKRILVASAFAMSAFFASAQDGRAFTQGGSTISVGYGLGNVWKSLFKMSGLFSGGSYKVSATGPVALQYEYGIKDRISVGASLGYAKVTGKYNDDDYKYEESLSNISVLARANYHFGQSEKFDPYLGVGLGYFNFKYKFKDSDGDTQNNMFNVPGAFGFSGQLGAKYFFTPKIGAYAEVGYVGGSIAQIGLTAKF